MNKLYEYNKLKKSLLTPPSYIFGIVWPILYLMIGLSIIFYLSSKEKSILGILLFILQLLLNLSWSPIFFKFKNYKLSFIIILLLIIIVYFNIIEFGRTNLLSSYLLIPYLIWILFASYLNLYIVINN